MLNQKTSFFILCIGLRLVCKQSKCFRFWFSLIFNLNFSGTRNQTSIIQVEINNFCVRKIVAFFSWKGLNFVFALDFCWLKHANENGLLLLLTFWIFQIIVLHDHKLEIYFQVPNLKLHSFGLLLKYKKTDLVPCGENMTITDFQNAFIDDKLLY